MHPPEVGARVQRPSITDLISILVNNLMISPGFLTVSLTGSV